MFFELGLWISNTVKSVPGSWEFLGLYSCCILIMYLYISLLVSMYSPPLKHSFTETLPEVSRP